MYPNEQHKSDAVKWAGRIITMVLLILIGLAIKLLCEIRAHDQAPMPVMPANYSIVRSPKGASLQIPVMPAPQPPQGVQITVGNTNPFSLQLSTTLPAVWRTVTNGVSQITLPMTWLNTFTNPMLGYGVTLAWDAVKGVSGYGLAWSTNSLDCGTNRMAQLLFSGQTNTVTAYAYLDNAVPGPKSNPVMAIGKPVFPPITDFFRTQQPSGVPPVLKIVRVTLP